MFGKNRTIRKTQEIVDNGIHEGYVNPKVDDRTEIAEYVQVFKKTVLPDNPKFPRLCEAFRKIKTGMGWYYV